LHTKNLKSKIMSLKAPTTKEEGKFQYCNYGYDTIKFKSFDDCMTNYNKVFYPPTTTDNKVACKDGTFDIGNGAVAPCINHGGQKDDFMKNAKDIVSLNGSWTVEKKIVYNVLITAVVLSISYYIYRKYKK